MISANTANTADFLDSLGHSRVVFGLERIQKLLALAGNPHRGLPAIHIGGTNGKGSTTAMLASILTEAGYKTGAYTSPHLVDVRERIAINTQPVSEEVFNRSLTRLKPLAESMASSGHHDIEEADGFPGISDARPVCETTPTYFEFLTAMAFDCFRAENVDIALFEVGLGGRLDATNVLEKPLASAITSIGYDHQDWLGETLSKIAGEKAGIIKPGVPVVLGPALPEEALRVLEGAAQNTGAPIHPAKACNIAAFEKNLALRGSYQKQNLATVLEILGILRRQGFEISDGAVRKGLMQARWPARFQLFEEAGMILDGSHNPEGFEALKESIEKEFLGLHPDRSLYWLLSLRKNRDPEALLAMVKDFPGTQKVFWTVGPDADLYHTPDSFSKNPALKNLSETGLFFSNPDEAFAALTRALKSPENPLGIITGSLYTAGYFLSKKL